MIFSLSPISGSLFTTVSHKQWWEGGGRKEGINENYDTKNAVSSPVAMEVMSLMIFLAAKYPGAAFEKGRWGGRRGEGGEKREGKKGGRETSYTTNKQTNKQTNSISKFHLILADLSTNQNCPWHHGYIWVLLHTCNITVTRNHTKVQRSHGNTAGSD